MGFAITRLALTLLGVLVGIIVDRIIFNPAWSFRGRTIATLRTLPLGVQLKVIGRVDEEFNTLVIRFDDEKYRGFLLDLQGVSHELRAGDVFEVFENPDKTREIHLCQPDEEAEWIAANLL